MIGKVVGPVGTSVIGGLGTSVLGRVGVPVRTCLIRRDERGPVWTSVIGRVEGRGGGAAVMIGRVWGTGWNIVSIMFCDARPLP